MSRKILIPEQGALKGSDSFSFHELDRNPNVAAWVKAVNEHGGFGRWGWAVSKNPGDVGETLHRLSN